LGSALENPAVGASKRKRQNLPRKTTAHFFSQHYREARTENLLVTHQWVMLAAVVPGQKIWRLTDRLEIGS
jgi:hypothetical protein